MAISGRYDFKGIKKAGAFGLRLALATTPWGGFLINGSLGKLTGLVLEFVANWLANKGLIILNVGALEVEGYFDQKDFDKSMDQGLAEVKFSHGSLTPQRIKEIDEAVIKAARKFVPFTSGKPKH